MQADESYPIRPRHEMNDERSDERVDDGLHVELSNQYRRHHRRRGVRLDAREKRVEERRNLEEREQHRAGDE